MQNYLTVNYWYKVNFNPMEILVLLTLNCQQSSSRKWKWFALPWDHPFFVKYFQESKLIRICSLAFLPQSYEETFNYLSLKTNDFIIYPLSSWSLYLSQITPADVTVIKEDGLIKSQIEIHVASICLLTFVHLLLNISLIFFTFELFCSAISFINWP